MPIFGLMGAMPAPIRADYAGAIAAVSPGLMSRPGRDAPRCFGYLAGRDGVSLMNTITRFRRCRCARRYAFARRRCYDAIFDELAMLALSAI